MSSAPRERESAAAYWGAHADEYNEFIVRVVPRYHEMLDRLLDYAPARATRVLELGTGTGNVAARLAARWPEASFTFVDGAPEMLDVARGRLAASAPHILERTQFLAARFEELRLERAAVDVVIASLSLHHVADVGAVYDRMAPAMASGGRLVMLDGLRGATASEHDVHMARWRAYWQQPGKLSADEIGEVSEHVERHDHYRTFAEHDAMLRRAGFAYVDCVWRDGLFALVSAAMP